MRSTLAIGLGLSLLVACGGKKETPAASEGAKATPAAAQAQSAAGTPAAAKPANPAKPAETAQATKTPPGTATGTPAAPTASSNAPFPPASPIPYAEPAKIQPEGAGSAGDWSPSKPKGEERADALAWRLERRSFEGSPPFIPHPVDGRTQDCRACHLTGATVAGTRVPRIAHTVYQNCTQCHVERRPAFMQQGDVGGPPLVGNSFEPLGYGRGTRYTPFSPPTMPHGHFMHENCVSCHGKRAPVGLQPSHSLRRNCTQCHVSEKFDIAVSR